MLEQALGWLSYFLGLKFLIHNISTLIYQELDDNLAELTNKFEAATSAKLKCQMEAEATAGTISLANR